MFTRLVSTASPLIVRHSTNTSNPSTEVMGSTLEQNEGFAEWWEQWVRGVQRNRAKVQKFTLTYGEQNRVACRRRLPWLVGTIAVCRSVLAAFFAVIRSAFNL